MRAILCEEPGRLVLVERPVPAPAPGEVLVRIGRAGVCGTDFHIFGASSPFSNTRASSATSSRARSCRLLRAAA